MKLLIGAILSVIGLLYGLIAGVLAINAYVHAQAPLRPSGVRYYDGLLRVDTTPTNTVKQSDEVIIQGTR